jgi:hypothetical protein
MLCKHCADIVLMDEIQKYCYKNSHNRFSLWPPDVCLECGIEVILGQTPELFIRPQYGGGQYGPAESLSPWQEMAIRSLEDFDD